MKSKRRTPLKDKDTAAGLVHRARQGREVQGPSLADGDDAVRGDQRALQDVHCRAVDARPAGVLPGQRVIPASSMALLSNFFELFLLILTVFAASMHAIQRKR